MGLPSKDCVNVKSKCPAAGVLRHSQTMDLCGCNRLGLEYARVALKASSILIQEELGKTGRI